MEKNFFPSPLQDPREQERRLTVPVTVTRKIKGVANADTAPQQDTYYFLNHVPAPLTRDETLGADPITN